MRHLMSPLDFSVEELDRLMDLAVDIETNPAKYAHACEGKKLATLFYEPSTRTRLSHDAEPGRKRPWILIGRIQFCRQGGERIRHHPHGFLLC